MYIKMSPKAMFPALLKLHWTERTQDVVWLRVQPHVPIEAILALERVWLRFTLRVRAEEDFRAGEGRSRVDAAV